MLELRVLRGVSLAPGAAVLFTEVHIASVLVGIHLAFVASLTGCPMVLESSGVSTATYASSSQLHKMFTSGFRAGNPALLCSLASGAIWNLGPMHCYFKQDKGKKEYLNALPQRNGKRSHHNKNFPVLRFYALKYVTILILDI